MTSWQEIPETAEQGLAAANGLSGSRIIQIVCEKNDKPCINIALAPALGICSTMEPAR
jgi:hypothetical protein